MDSKEDIHQNFNYHKVYGQRKSLEPVRIAFDEAKLLLETYESALTGLMSKSDDELTSARSELQQTKKQCKVLQELNKDLNDQIKSTRDQLTRESMRQQDIKDEIMELFAKIENIKQG